VDSYWLPTADVQALLDGQTRRAYTIGAATRSDPLMNPTKKEKDYYPGLKSLLEELLKSSFSEFHLEITATKTFSNKLKAEIPDHRNLIFHFIKEAPPDITGFIREQYTTDFFVAEFKKETLRLDDIYQARKYAELFDARYALLITTEEIPEELKRLSKIVHALLSLGGGYSKLTLVRFDEQQRQFVDWLEENPFLKGASGGS
jgi:hypothetical protein